MTTRTSRTNVGLLSVLATNDRVEARDFTGSRCAGSVELTAPELGVLWINTDNGERKALDVYEYEIRREI
jgi:hypothetical protein